MRVRSPRPPPTLRCAQSYLPRRAVLRRARVPHARPYSPLLTRHSRDGGQGHPRVMRDPVLRQQRGTALRSRSHHHHPHGWTRRGQRQQQGVGDASYQRCSCLPPRTPHNTKSRVKRRVKRTTACACQELLLWRVIKVIPTTTITSQWLWRPQVPRRASHRKRLPVRLDARPNMGVVFTAHQHGVERYGGCPCTTPATTSFPSYQPHA